MLTMVDKKESANYSIQVKARQTARFSAWLTGLPDVRAKARILKRLDRAAAGNLGDVAPVSGGVSEMRIFYGPGYRLYFVQRGDKVILLLCGGDKSTQQNDIGEARALAEGIE